MNSHPDAVAAALVQHLCLPGPRDFFGGVDILRKPLDRGSSRRAR